MKSIKILLPLCCLLLIGCLETKQSINEQPLSKTEALTLAVSIANEECLNKFSLAPFDSAAFPIDSIDGRWQWGELDLKGSHGFSAVVSFDRFGLNSKVDVFLSTDSAINNRNIKVKEED